MSDSPKLHRLKNWVAVVETFIVLVGLRGFAGGILCLLAPIPMRGVPVLFAWLFWIPLFSVFALCVLRTKLLQSEADLLARQKDDDHVA